ncbi:MAG: cell wall hydrolase [Bacilli bacterium]
MPRVKVNENEVQLLARLMRAEAEGEGKEGMLMVGNVCVNRVVCDCLDFKQLRTITDMVYQEPGGFEAPKKGYFYQAAREVDIELAKRVIAGERIWPAKYSLWFFRPSGECPDQWFNQPFVGRYKSHCFFEPEYDNCPGVYNT